MYKRTAEAILNNLPTRGGTYAGKAQFGKPEYQEEVYYAVTTRIDASGAYFLLEMEEDEDTSTKRNEGSKRQGADSGSGHSSVSSQDGLLF